VLVPFSSIILSTYDLVPSSSSPLYVFFRVSLPIPPPLYLFERISKIHLEKSLLRAVRFSFKCGRDGSTEKFQHLKTSLGRKCNLYNCKYIMYMLMYWYLCICMYVCMQPTSAIWISGLIGITILLGRIHRIAIQAQGKN